MTRKIYFLSSAMVLIASTALATIFGSVRGIVHDPQHRPVEGAIVMLKAKSSDWTKSANTNANGEFALNAIPIGEYAISVASPGFAEGLQSVVVTSGTQPVVHFQLSLASAKETVNVSGAPQVAPTDSATPVTLINRLDIERTPGADRTNSLAMITDYVPGAYFTHDQLHIRGGHQVSWLVDGVPVPNTNIASNLGPQFDPRDIDYLEVNRGSYGSEFGDRTYGVFNVVPRSGFERNNQAELVTTFGNFYQTNDQLNFGSHTQRFAYYASANGNRSNLGIQTPVSQVIHDATNSYGGFGSFILNVDPSNQLRLVTSLRKDYYQIPYDANFHDHQSAVFDSSGLRDGQHEGDALVNFSWVHTLGSQLLLTVSPFYHYNSANYDSASNDYPTATIDHRASIYAGGQVSFNANVARNNLQVGFFGFGQHDRQLFGAIFNCPSNNDPNFVPCDPTQLPSNFSDRELASGGLAALFLDDKFKVTPWLTLIAGMRPTHFSGGISESAVSPRFGAALSVPRLNWVFRGFYGNYYQAPPLITASGPLLQFVTSQNLAFRPLHGERDEEHQFGVTIPYHGWIIDADTFKTGVRNFFDHNNVGNSNIYFPISIARVAIRGWEATLHSPRIAHRGQIHLAYSNQIAQGALPITGGLTNLAPPGPLFLLDHDQRNTLNVGGDVSLPRSSFASVNIYYGSGFTDSGGPAHLPPHTNLDLSLGKDFGERFSASLNLLNVANRHLLLDNSLTFGGFHWNNPREIYGEFRYRFHY